MPNPVTAISTVAGAVLSKRSADKQEQAIRAQADRDLALRKQMYEEDVARQEPFRQAGLTAMNQLAALYSPETGAFFKAPTMNELLMDPGYTFRLAEGEKALARQQAARGRYLSGGAIKAGQEFAQGLASQEGGAALERERMRRTDISNVLANLAGYGPTAAAQLGVGGRAYAQGAAGAFGDIGAAQAGRAGQVGNIYQTVLGDILKGMPQGGVTPSRQSSYGGSAVPFNSMRYGYYEPRY